MTFSDQLQTRHNLTPDAAKNVQFYLHGEIRIERDVSDTQHDITPGHSLIERNGRTVEIVTVSDKTPGVLVSLSGEMAFVNFSSVSDSDTLLFRHNQDGDRYELLVLKGDLLQEFLPNGKFDNDTKYTILGATEDSVSLENVYKALDSYGYLQVEVDQLNSESRKERRLRGRSLPPMEKSP